MDFNLQTIQVDLEEKYQSIKHITGDHLLKLSSDSIIIFDVRQKKEFDVSHIKDALQTEPNIDRKNFIREFSDQLKGKNLIFYCSVGQRSSALASQLQPLLTKNGALEVYNLKGGIFQWHNEKKELIQNKKSTQFIHPYSPLWGLLLDDKKAIRFQPDNHSK